MDIPLGGGIVEFQEWNSDKELEICLCVSTSRTAD